MHLNITYTYEGFNMSLYNLDIFYEIYLILKDTLDYCLLFSVRKKIKRNVK